MSTVYQCTFIQCTFAPAYSICHANVSRLPTPSSPSVAEVRALPCEFMLVRDANGCLTHITCLVLTDGESVTLLV